MNPSVGLLRMLPEPLTDFSQMVIFQLSSRGVACGLVPCSACIDVAFDSAPPAERPQADSEARTDSLTRRLRIERKKVRSV